MADLLPVFLQGKSVSTPKGMRCVSVVRQARFSPLGLQLLLGFSVFWPQKKREKKNNTKTDRLQFIFLCCLGLGIQKQNKPCVGVYCRQEEFMGLDLGYGIRIQEAIQMQLIPLPSNRPVIWSTHKNYSALGGIINKVDMHMLPNKNRFLILRF